MAFSCQGVQDGFKFTTHYMDCSHILVNIFVRPGTVFILHVASCIELPFEHLLMHARACELHFYQDSVFVGSYNSGFGFIFAEL